MSFDMGWLLASFAIGAVGFILLQYGRKFRRPPQVIAGIAMLVYPYFVHNVVVMLIVAAGLSLLTWAAVYLGL